MGFFQHLSLHRRVNFLIQCLSCITSAVRHNINFTLFILVTSKYNRNYPRTAPVIPRNSAHRASVIRIRDLGSWILDLGIRDLGIKEIFGIKERKESGSWNLGSWNPGSWDQRNFFTHCGPHFLTRAILTLQGLTVTKMKFLFTLSLLVKHSSDETKRSNHQG